MGEHGREVVADPEVLAAGDALPEVKDANVDELGHEVGGHGGEDDADGVSEDHVVGGVVHF